MLIDDLFDDEISVKVMRQNHVIGVLSTTNNGLEFKYDTDWMKWGEPLSAQLSFSGNFKSSDVHAYFDSFMPEGSRRETMANLEKISASDLVGFLRRHGEDLQGDIHTEPLGKSNGGEDITRYISKTIAQDISFARIKQHSLLAGVDDKLAVRAFYKNNQWVFELPNIDNPSTHIIKKGNFLCVNEYFCMTLAQMCGLSVMPCTILAHNNVEAFLTKRFDRTTDSKGNTIRLEQKDFCQLVGKSPDEKYFRGFSGFSNNDIVKILKPLPISETWKFLYGSMFSLIIGNSDDHGKNYSLLYEKGQEPVLAPFYDLSSISGMMMFHPESTGSTRLARPIGKAQFAVKLTVNDMREHIKLFGVDFIKFTEIFSQLVTTIKDNTFSAKEKTVALLKECELQRLMPEAEFLAEHVLGRLDEFFLDFSKNLQETVK